MVKLGNLLFHNRNWLFPLFYLVLFIPSPEVFNDPVTAMLIGFGIALIGQLIRIITIGLVYIVRGGRNRRVYADDLVTTGIFSHCRNPLYVGNILILVGLGVGIWDGVWDWPQTSQAMDWHTPMMYLPIGLVWYSS